jgi:hypothetical protein
MAENDKRPMNDRTEGIMRDPVNYKGEIVSYVKDIGNGDPGYDAKIRQVLIMLQDGTEKVVPEADIMREKPKTPPQMSDVLDRRPEETLPKTGADDSGKNRQAREAPKDNAPKG